MLMAQMRAVCLILYECYLLKIAALSNIKSTCLKSLNKLSNLQKQFCEDEWYNFLNVIFIHTIIWTD